MYEVDIIKVLHGVSSRIKSDKCLESTYRGTHPWQTLVPSWPVPILQLTLTCRLSEGAHQSLTQERAASTAEHRLPTVGVDSGSEQTHAGSSPKPGDYHQLCTLGQVSSTQPQV